MTCSLTPWILAGMLMGCWPLAAAGGPRKNPAAAAAAARESLKQNPTGPAARKSRIALCKAVAEAPELGVALEPSLDEMRRMAEEAKATGKPPWSPEEAPQPPNKIYGPAPVYTDRARRERYKGDVIIEVVLDQEGCIRDAHILRGGRTDMERAALQAVRQWCSSRPCPRADRSLSPMS